MLKSNNISTNLQYALNLSKNQKKEEDFNKAHAYKSTQWSVCVKKLKLI